MRFKKALCVFLIILFVVSIGATAVSGNNDGLGGSAGSSNYGAGIGGSASSNAENGHSGSDGNTGS